MKKIIIIGTYPNTKDKENMLSDCIDRLSRIGYDLMIVSHYPIPEYIQNKVDFIIYDKENTLEPYHLTPVYHYYADDFTVEVSNQGHITTVCRNINNGLGLAKHLGYNFFYHIESDNIFSDEDIKKLDELSEKMFNQNKEMILFGYNHDGIQIYESLIFGGKPSYFLHNMQLPLYVDDFERMNVDYTLETTFYSNLKSNEHEFLIINEPSDSFFNTSEINKVNNFSQIEILYDVVNDRYVLWISNLIQNKKSIYVTIDNSEEFELIPNGWTILPILSDNPININVNENGIIKNKIFKFTPEDKVFYSNKATILFN
jgi:hypothetical protein